MSHELAEIAPGIRISVRWNAPEAARDVVGEVVRAGADHVVLQPWNRGAVAIPVAEVSAWRSVPPRAVRPSSTPADLERIASRGWPGLETERLGAWELRAARGWSMRANSVLPEGDPGVELDTALSRVEQFYCARNLSPALQLAARRGAVHPLADELQQRGWTPRTPATLMVADLRRLPAAALPAVRWHQVPDAAWLEANGRPHEARSAVLLAAPALFLTVDGEQQGRPAAIARVAPTADWIGVSCLWVDPAQRGRGLGAAVMTACVQQGLALGARFGYLQVERGNETAHWLYERLGWSDHHDYEYWCPR